MTSVFVPSAQGFGKLLWILMLLHPILEFPPFFLSLSVSPSVSLSPLLHCMWCLLSGSAVRQSDIQLGNRLGPCGRLQRSKPPASAVTVWFVPSGCSLDRFSVSVSCCWRRLVFLHDMPWNLQVIIIFTWMCGNWVCPLFTTCQYH